jgi:hypothetical protein
MMRINYFEAKTSQICGISGCLVGSKGKDRSLADAWLDRFIWTADIRVFDGVRHARNDLCYAATAGSAV